MTITAAASTITVDNDGVADYDNIHDAINVANDGDTILVYPGLKYEESILNIR